MQMTFQSKTLKSAEYTAGSRVLEVEFHSGNVYQYHDVPPEIAEEFFRSESVGGFFNQFIKDRYLTFKITE
jgi:hypothetical protein